MNVRNTLLTVVSASETGGWHDISTASPLRVLSGANEGGTGIDVIGTVICDALNCGDGNVTNVGNIALDSITADGSAITITGNTTFADGAYDFDIASHDTSNGLKLGGTLVTATAAELNYVDGVTSAIQTQIDGKSPTAGNTSLVTVGTIAAGTWAATDVAVAHGGTGASTDTAARTNLGLVIGTNVLAEQTIGIADNNLVEIDDADAANDDYAKFTANGLEGRSYTEVKTDLGLVIGTNVQAYNATLATVAGGTYAGDDSIVTVGAIGTGTWQGTAIADGYIASASTWNAKQDALTFGKSSGNALKSEEALTTNDILLMGTSHAKGRTYSELKTDLGLNNVENTAISTWAGTSNITTLGTIGTGVWQGTAVGQAYIANEAINEAKLQISNAGSNGQVLTKQSGNTGGLTWADDATGGGGGNLTTKGDLEVYTTSQGRLAVHATNGFVLTVDSTAAAGIAWKASTGGSGDITTDGAWVAAGDLIVGTGTDTAGILTKGTTGHVLKAAAGGLEWAAESGGGSGTITALNNQTENRLVSIGSTTTELDGEANLTFTGSRLTVGGDVSASGGFSSAVKPITTLTSNGVVTYDITGPALQTIVIKANQSNTYLGTETLPIGKTITVRLSANGADRTLGWHTSMNFIGEKPVSIARDKIALLSVTTFGTLCSVNGIDTDVVCAYAVED